MALNTNSIDQMISELRATTSLVQGKAVGSGQAANAAGSTGSVDFSQALRSALDQVNQAQTQAHQMAENFSAGQDNVSLQDVMINLQKANLSFQQVVQVRNKLVSAYHDVMNMQV